MVGQEGDGIECLPPRTFGKLCTRLLVNDVQSDLSVLADFLLGTSHREDASEVVNNRLFAVALRTEVRSHFLILGQLLLGNAKRFLDRVTVKLVAVRNLHHLLGLGSERERQSVVAHNTDRREAHIDRVTVLMRIGEEEVGLHSITTEQLEGFLDLRKSPHDLAVTERTSGVHLHLTSGDEVVKELKR